MLKEKDAYARHSLALVFPVYNEEDVLPQLMEEVQRFREKNPYVEQVIFVDDGSKDRSVELIKKFTADDKGVVLLQFSRNFGHQLAITAGISLVKTDAAVILDADLQDPLDVVEEMVSKWREGFDVVYGQRIKREGEKSYKLWAASAFYRFFRWMSDIDMPLDTGDFRLISKKVIEAFNEMADAQPFVRGLVTWLGFSQVAVPYVRAPRAAGTSKYTFSKLLGLALSGLTSFTEKPLRIATRFGFVTAVLSLLGVLGYVGYSIFSGAGLSTLTVLAFTGFFFGGVQLLFLGIIGIYLIRVYGEVKGRPRYVIDEVWQPESSINRGVQHVVPPRTHSTPRQKSAARLREPER